MSSSGPATLTGLTARLSLPYVLTRSYHTTTGGTTKPSIPLSSPGPATLQLGRLQIPVFPHLCPLQGLLHYNRGTTKLSLPYVLIWSCHTTTGDYKTQHPSVLIRSCQTTTGGTTGPRIPLLSLRGPTTLQLGDYKAQHSYSVLARTHYTKSVGGLQVPVIFLSESESTTLQREGITKLSFSSCILNRAS